MTDQERVDQDIKLYKQVSGASFVPNDRYVQLVRCATVRLAEFMHEHTRSALLAKAPPMKFSQERVEMYRMRADQLKQRLMSKPLVPSDVLQPKPTPTPQVQNPPS